MFGTMFSSTYRNLETGGFDNDDNNEGDDDDDDDGDDDYDGDDYDDDDDDDGVDFTSMKRLARTSFALTG